MSLPEIHQISFERYLRKKMDAEEKAEFEEKLTADPEFRAAFQHYKLKRKAYLTELIDDYDSEFKAKSKITHFIYTLLTLIFLCIIAILYLDNKQLKQQIVEIYEIGTRTIYRTIPFVGNKQATPPPSKSKIKTYKDSIDTVLFDTLSQSLPNAQSFISGEKVRRDELLKDTMLMVALMSAATNDTNTVAAEILLKRIRFWKSPIGFEGYKYDGNSLDLFGIEDMDDVHLFKEKNELWFQIGRVTKRAIPDNQYHKL